jgi:hypothetical protein
MPPSSCPSCGAALHFRSSVSVYVVCASCGSMVVRSDVEVETIGRMASLPGDISPLQIGTKLTHAGRAYTLLGRTRMAWDDGAWTEWFMDDGTVQGWLADAQGFLSVSFEQPLPPLLATAAWPVLGDAVTLEGKIYRVSDLKQATCIGSEGELPFAAPRGRTARYADMISLSAGFASIEESKEGRRLYFGAYVRFDELHFDGLRPVEGWARPGPGAAGDPQFPPAP